MPSWCRWCSRCGYGGTQAFDLQKRKRADLHIWDTTDWRNREKWEEYEQAVNDTVQYTSTRVAPWILVEGNNKPYARIKVLKILCKQLEKALSEEPQSAS